MPVLQESPEKCLTIFLDIDGVLHTDPQPASDLKLFEKLPLLVDVLTQYEASLEVVISSSWRDKYTYAQISDRFMPELAHLVAGATPQLKLKAQSKTDWMPPISNYERQNECERWLKDNRQWGQAWIAIDDRASWFEPGCRNLLVTDPRKAFTADDAKALHSMIRDFL